ncbi:MAG: ABC-2 type transport system permease protein [Paraglaciecola sp.]|jgi:ABC-2 type transport system permease protein
MNRLQITTSFKKEMLEFEKVFFWVPGILAGIMILAPFLVFALTESYQRSGLFEFLMQGEERANLEGIGHFFFGAMSGLFVPFIIVALVIQLYYFTACLFEERRDLSISFWRSLPVSDALSIGVKLITGALVIPAIFMLAATAVLIFALFLVFIVCIVMSVGYDVSLWGLWGNAEIISNLGAIWLNLIPYALWSFPLYAWLMLASMFAKKAPFLWAVLPLVVLVLVEAFIVNYFGFSSTYIADLLVDYFTFSSDVMSSHMMESDGPKLILLKGLSSKVSLLPMLFGCGLMYLTYWLRVNRSEV